MNAEIELEAYSELTDIQKFFLGRSVFVTGATGFIGKVLVEKLLRCCPGIGMVYLLLRPKKGLTPEERLEKIFSVELFSKIKDVFPGFRKKVCLVNGDITEKRLGISDEDWEKIRGNVSVVMHSAASVHFNDPIKVAVQHNMAATLEIMKLCKEMPLITAIVHVSTAYIKREPDGSVLEKIPECKINPRQLLDAMEWMDESSQKAVENYLLEGKLTTYLVTKALAENIILEECGDMPTAIVRPCFVSSTCRDPFPGWVDTIQGISGLLMAGAKGVLRALVSVEGLKLNVMPVDFVVNSVVASAWHVATEKPQPIYVMNCVFDYETLPLANQEILDFALKKRDEYPLVNVYRYPNFTIYYNEFAYRIHSLFDEWIPALIIDLLLFILTGKTVLIKVYQKIGFLYGIFYKLGRVPWICRIENYNALKNRLEGEDKEIFFMDTDNFDWYEYMENCLIGGRKFIANEDPSNIPYAKKKAKVWWAVTTILKWCIILFVLYYVFSRYFSSSSAGEKIFNLYS